MSELYKRIEALCLTNGITITEMCRRAGVPRANLTELKMGRQQKLGISALEKIAKYFKVPIETLVNPEKENSPSGELDRDRIKFALFGTAEIDDAKLDEVLRYAAYVKDL